MPRAKVRSQVHHDRAGAPRGHASALEASTRLRLPLLQRPPPSTSRHLAPSASTGLPPHATISLLGAQSRPAAVTLPLTLPLTLTLTLSPQP